LTSPFDDPNVAAHAGPSLIAQLAARLEVRKLIPERLPFGQGTSRAANPDLKAMILISALVADAECVADESVRARFIVLFGRLARSGWRLHLHLPQNWPWQDAFLAARENLVSLVIPAATPA
jgi:hypothetical protein